MFSNPHVGIYYVYKFLENKPLMYLNEMNIKEYPKYNYFEMYIFGKIQSKSRWDRDQRDDPLNYELFFCDIDSKPLFNFDEKSSFSYLSLYLLLLSFHLFIFQ